MSLPLDSDGFLRRECPTCEREFKWFSSPKGEGAAPEPSGYFCPYCRIQAPTDSFFTAAQIELAKNVVVRDLVGPELDKLGRNLRGNRRPGDLISIEFSATLPPKMDPLVETDDMRRVAQPTELQVAVAHRAARALREIAARQAQEQAERRAKMASVQSERRNVA
jgi:hypothetical protein